MAVGFDRNWFDVLSFFIVESDAKHISVHAYKRPYTCIKFMIPVEWMTEPGLFNKVHKQARSEWNKKDEYPACPSCGTTRRNWMRSYEGRNFCGVCGRDS